jgi:hypothetical protein
MLRVSAIAVCVALVAVSGHADADPAVAERLRVQGAYVTETQPAPQRRVHDVFVSAVPELSLVWQSRGSVVNLMYSLTGTLHPFSGASEIANRLALLSSFSVSKQTTLNLGAMAAQTSVTNLFISQPATGSTIAVFPPAGARLITAQATQAIAHELTPRLRLDQQTDATFTTTLAPSPPLDTFTFGAGLGLERMWRYDGVGVETRAIYAVVRTAPPTPVQKVATTTLGPRWRHDWSRSLSSLVTVGGTLVSRLDSGVEPVVAEYARGSLLYTVDETSAGLTVGTGVVPNPLTRQLVHAHSASVYCATPLSRRARVYAGGSVGVQRANLIDPPPANTDVRFDSVLTDVEVTWAVSPLVQIFGRYQFFAQFGESTAVGANPSFLRDLFLVGVQLSSRPPMNARAGRSSVMEPEVVTGVPQRVDRSDAATDSTVQETSPPEGDTPVPAQPAEEE